MKKYISKIKEYLDKETLWIVGSEMISIALFIVLMLFSQHLTGIVQILFNILALILFFATMILLMSIFYKNKKESGNEG